jgi:hypothetical protein
MNGGADHRFPRGITRVVGIIGATMVVAAACGNGETAAPQTSATTTGETPASSPTSSPVSDLELEPFTSKVYGYSISHPAGWSVTEATRSLHPGQPPAEESPGIDLVQAPERDRSMRVGAQDLNKGSTLED